MKKLSVVSLVLAAAVLVQAGAIVPELDDSTAIGSFTTAHNGVINEVANIGTGEITLAARFNPDVSQAAAGPVIVIENGGTSNGTGLYLANGNLIFVSKANGQFAVPTGLDDTDFSNDNNNGKSMAVDLGPVHFGVENKVYVAMDLNRGELFASVNGFPTWYTITGAGGGENLDGNRSVSFLGADPIEYGHMGGLLEAAEAEFPFLFWTNAVPMVQTAGYDNQLGQVFNTAVMPLTLPHDPTPADGAVKVDPAAVTGLSFYPGDDPENAGSPNPAITGHWVTVFAVENGEPNFVDPPLAVSPLIPAGTEPVTYPFAFSEDDVVYWQVEEQVQGRDQGDPNNITGMVWSFEAVPSVPVINESPADVLRYPVTSPDYEGPAVLTCRFTSKSMLTAVEWYRGDNPTTPLSDADADITITLDQNGNDYTSTLTIDNVEVADEDSYWCFVQNTADTATSDTANLAVKRPMAHWTLDQVDLVNGQYIDISGEGHDADPNVVPGAASFVDAQYPGKTGQALDLDVEPLAAADSGVWNPSLFSGQITVSLWVKWAEANNQIHGMVCGRSSEVNSWFFEVNGGRLQANAPGYNPFGTPITAGEWVHVVLTAADGAGTIYVNGLEAAHSSNYAINPVEVPVLIGAANRVDGTLVSLFNGAMDDVQIYNYAMTDTQVADLYYAVSEASVCLNPISTFDIAGGGANGDEPDCKVDLLDLAALAGHWLECGLYPVCP